MKKNFIWASIAVAAIIIIGGVAYVGGGLLTSNNKVTEANKNDAK
ncbi:hypothetical protein [Clostridium omnivorum]|uniref:Biopterin-dependent aromatic amino acid hydroxylase family profile domain-containing protein n=1 Tax=Clostridium omnivorum TaxID=1604902 RepID=A0ABQ5N9J9_9CLOT|nr:hypothetical protein [Clostridium sp. E14]GLC31933.1 hypothetical protein bsdE14_33430 [Clostridium sp. E14]